MKKCAILTMDCLDDYEAYDDLLIEPLAALGWQAEFVSWRKADVDWNQYLVVMIRSPWDYQNDAEQFLQVLADIEASNAILENSLAIVKNNIDKRYLAGLEQQGVAIVPTAWHQNYSELALEALFDQFNTEQLVIKPCISAGADNTYWLTRANYQDYSDELANVFASRKFMVQPFMPAITQEGEYSLFYFDGQYSHAILKTPKPDDFRVQEEHGGRLTLIEPELALTQAAEKTLSAIGENLLYARVDYVRNGDGFALMEAELIEPSLYFNMDENSPQRFAEAFVARMQRLYQL